MQGLNENGLTLSPKKCYLTMESVEFLGYIFTQDGLKSSIIKIVKNKVKAGVSNSLKDATKKDKMMKKRIFF